MLERIQELHTATLQVSGIAGHQRPASDLGGGGQQPVDDRKWAPDVEPAPFLCDIGIHADQVILIGHLQSPQPPLQQAGLRLVLAAQPLYAQPDLTDGEDAEVVFVAHLDVMEVPALERAARAVLRGAPLLTSSYARGYAGANGIIFSRGAMITAAIAKVTGARPKVLGKPSRAAVREVSERLGSPADQLVVIGDDLGMDIALGRLGGSRTILVRSGISGQIDLDRVPERHRPDTVIDRVGDLLRWL